MARLTVVFACALVGLISAMVNCGVAVAVMGEVPVGAGVKVLVAKGAGVTGVAVAGSGVGEATVGVTGVSVPVGGGVGEEGVRLAGGVQVGVMNAGVPNSLQPRSGAAPVNPVIGLGGTGSPFAARY